MEQVYYTQCPIGYGLGAANGFQVKRISPGYPATGDFRHLALRVFLPGTRDLAPPALRYRRDGDMAEVAWLTPRAHEYETEGGRLWGRPGGQFIIPLDPTACRGRIGRRQIPGHGGRVRVFAAFMGGEPRQQGQDGTAAD